MARVRMQPVVNEFLRHVMEEQGIEETIALAEFLGIPESTARHWIARSAVRPSAELAIRVSEKLKMPLTEVINNLAGAKVAS